VLPSGRRGRCPSLACRFAAHDARLAHQHRDRSVAAHALQVQHRLDRAGVDRRSSRRVPVRRPGALRQRHAGSEVGMRFRDTGPSTTTCARAMAPRQGYRSASLRILAASSVSAPIPPTVTATAPLAGRGSRRSNNTVNGGSHMPTKIQRARAGAHLSLQERRRPVRANAFSRRSAVTPRPGLPITGDRQGRVGT
jgi:hypothetical protein